MGAGLVERLVFWLRYTSNDFAARPLIPMDPDALYFYRLDDAPWAWIWAMQFVAMVAVAA